MHHAPISLRDRALVVLETREEAAEAFRLAIDNAGPDVQAIDVVCLWHFPLRPSWNGIHRGLARDLMHDCDLFPVEGPQADVPAAEAEPAGTLTDELFDPNRDDLCHGHTPSGTVVQLLRPSAKTLAGVFRSLAGNRIYSLIIVGSRGGSEMAIRTWRHRVKCRILFTGTPAEAAV